MHISVGAVNIRREVAGRSGYHHGNLRAALLEAGVGLARAGGPEAVIVREASRRVGVSHNAAYRHFPDRDALLGAVGECGMTELAGLMERLITEVGPGDVSLEAARRRLRATGAAYVRFALAQPGLFRTAFAIPDRLPALDSEQGDEDQALGPFGLLSRQLDELERAGGLGPGRRPSAEITAWSAVHGFSMLLLEGPLRGLGEGDRAAALEHVLDTVERGLASRE
ncbi:MAG: TetR/AcrR family transcriptional regulator [Solirubrobacteraceae bacterium]